MPNNDKQKMKSSSLNFLICPFYNDLFCGKTYLLPQHNSFAPPPGRGTIYFFNRSQTSKMDWPTGLNSMPIAFLIFELSKFRCTLALWADTLSIAGAPPVKPDQNAEARQAISIIQGLA